MPAVNYDLHCDIINCTITQERKLAGTWHPGWQIWLRGGAEDEILLCPTHSMQFEASLREGVRA